MPGTQKTHLWLRAEVKPFEHRTPVTPDICKKLLDEGAHAVHSTGEFAHSGSGLPQGYRSCMLATHPLLTPPHTAFSRAGFRITVEKSHDRCVPDEEYAAYVDL